MGLVLHAPVDLEPDRHIVDAVALPLWRGGCVLPAGLRVVRPPEVWHNQGAERPDGFDALPFARDPLNPDGGLWAAADIAAYAEDVLDAQLVAGATLALTPAHRLGEEGAHGRFQDLALAEATVAAWDARQAWRPPPDTPDGAARQLFAAIAVDAAVAARVPVGAYAALDVDGFWITARGTQLGAVARLALDLQRRTGRPAVVDAPGDAHLGLLATGVAAACAAPAQNLFHPDILSAIPAGPVARRLFRERPCRCGTHDPAAPPADPAAHNLWHLQQEGLEVTGMAPPIAEARLLARAGRASRKRRELGLPPLSTRWDAIIAAARDLRAAA